MKWFSERSGENAIQSSLHRINANVPFKYSYQKTFEDNLKTAIALLQSAGWTADRVGSYVADVIRIAQESTVRKYDPSSSLERQCERGDASAWRTVLSTIVPPGARKILIVGCNDGSEWTLARSVFGIDCNILALKQNNNQTALASINWLPFRDKTFDCYVGLRTHQISGVLYIRALNEAHRVLRTYGEAILSFPTLEYARKSGELTKRPRSKRMEECSADDLFPSTKKYLADFDASFKRRKMYRYLSEDFLIGIKS